MAEQRHLCFLKGESNMERRNVQHDRRRNRQRKYTLISCALIVTLLFSVVLLWNYGKEAGDKNIDNPPITITKSNAVKNETDSSETQSPEDETDWNLTLVNRQNAVPANYKADLVEVSGGEKVDRRIYEPLMEMLEAAKEGNWDQLPMVVSGYRTQATQQKLYDDKIAKYKKEGYSESEAIEQAKQWVAVPGYSEHQLGLAVDINGATYDVYFWLQENSYKYGFIFRYPAGKTDITGTAEEVWHYRYVGVEAATEIYERGICLEEYLEKKQ